MDKDKLIIAAEYLIETEVPEFIEVAEYIKLLSTLQERDFTYAINIDGRTVRARNDYINHAINSLWNEALANLKRYFQTYRRLEVRSIMYTKYDPIIMQYIYTLRITLHDSRDLQLSQVHEYQARTPEI